MQEADLRARLRYIFHTDDIPLDSALRQTEVDGIVFLQSDGAVSSTDIGKVLSRVVGRGKK